MKQTKTPWVIGTGTYDGEAYIYLEGDDPEKVDAIGEVKDKETANHIVKCVNAYEGLKEESERLKELGKRIMSLCHIGTDYVHTCNASPKPCQLCSDLEMLGIENE